MQIYGKLKAFKHIKNRNEEIGKTGLETYKSYYDNNLTIYI